MSDNRGSALWSIPVVMIVNLTDATIAAHCGAPVELKITFSGCLTCIALLHCIT